MRVTVAEFEDSAVTFSAQNLPESAVFTSGGELLYRADSADIGRREVTFSAVFGGESASLKVQFLVLAGGGITVGPNPFSDSLTIFLGPNSGNLEEISIHLASGEKVWESSADNNISQSATVTWYGTNSRGGKIAPGVYFIVVRTDRVTQKFKVFMM